MFSSESQAVKILDDQDRSYREREAAVKYLADLASPSAIRRLVVALQDDNISVRWEAAVSIANLGDTALPEVLKALTDPHRVGDPRLRQGVYHILHTNASLHLPQAAGDLMRALKGPGADIATMEAAGRLLHQIEAHRHP